MQPILVRTLYLRDEKYNIIGCLVYEIEKYFDDRCNENRVSKIKYAIELSHETRHTSNPKYVLRYKVLETLIKTPYVIYLDFDNPNKLTIIEQIYRHILLKNTIPLAVKRAILLRKNYHEYTHSFIGDFNLVFDSLKEKRTPYTTLEPTHARRWVLPLKRSNAFLYYQKITYCNFYSLKDSKFKTFMTKYTNEQNNLEPYWWAKFYIFTQ